MQVPNIYPCPHIPTHVPTTNQIQYISGEFELSTFLSSMLDQGTW